MAVNLTVFTDGQTKLNATNLNPTNRQVEQNVEDITVLQNAVLQVDNKLDTKSDSSHTHSGYANASDLNNKVDKVSGKSLSTNDYTTTEKNKLAGIEANANNYIHPSSHSATMITESSTKRFVTDTEKTTWNNKSNFDGNYNSLTNKPSIPTVSNDLTNTLKSNYDKAYTHSSVAHAPSTAQKNSDITKAEIEAKLTGNIASHTHNSLLLRKVARILPTTESVDFGKTIPLDKELIVTDICTNETLIEGINYSRTTTGILIREYKDLTELLIISKEGN